MRLAGLVLILTLTWSQAGFALTDHYRNLSGPVREFFDQQYQDAYALLARLRHPQTGVYRDAFATVGQDAKPSSTGATGVGLIALTIADREGWEENAAVLAEQTLRSVNGLDPSFQPDRQPETGFFRHWIDPATGRRAWNSEYSTIDTALLVHGALFAAAYFEDYRQIRRLALDLYFSVAWERAVADQTTGTLYMVVDEEGEGREVTRPFNEYTILSYLAALDSRSEAAVQAWENVYHPRNLQRLPRLQYEGYELLSDGTMLSSFVPQFVFYLVPHYTLDSNYIELLRQASAADKHDWSKRFDLPDFVWGHGAGTEEGLGADYLANAIGKNEHGIASPYIIAGFLPVYPQGIQDLYHIYLNYLPYDSYENEDDKMDTRRFRRTYEFGLLRFAPYHSRWYAGHMSAVDWSSMLYGLGAFKHGLSIFTDYSNFEELIEKAVQSFPTAA